MNAPENTNTQQYDIDDGTQPADMSVVYNHGYDSTHAGPSWPPAGHNSLLTQDTGYAGNHVNVAPGGTLYAPAVQNTVGSTAPGVNEDQPEDDLQRSYVKADERDVRNIKRLTKVAGIAFAGMVVAAGAGVAMSSAPEKPDHEITIEGNGGGVPGIPGVEITMPNSPATEPGPSAKAPAVTTTETSATTTAPVEQVADDPTETAPGTQAPDAGTTTPVEQDPVVTEPDPTQQNPVEKPVQPVEVSPQEPDQDTGTGGISDGPGETGSGPGDTQADPVEQPADDEPQQANQGGEEPAEDQTAG